MSQDIVNPNQNISYTNLDFSSIYTEVLNLVKDLTTKWDPSISDESDPGVILLKLSALIADKCNYNIDKSILEAFPLSVTQDGNARQLYEQLGYYMDWYKSATVPVVLNWVKKNVDTSDVNSYTIPKFTMITDIDSKIRYALIGIYGGSDEIVVSDGIITTDSKELRMVAMEGTPAKYTYLSGETVITSQMVNKYSNRLYFDGDLVSQNGIFITNTGQQNFASWKRVDNLYEQPYNDLRYKFGYDTSSGNCYLEFPDNYAELFGDGIEITYMIIDSSYTDVPAQFLNKFYVDVTPKEDTAVTLNSDNVNIQNYAAASGHSDKESINDAYVNYKKTVGTFSTLITLRDYLNFIRSKELDLCSNAFVCDRTNDIQSTYKIVSKHHDLDSIIVKVEQLVDKNLVESNFNYTFIKSLDENSISGKTYYTITNDILSEVQDASGGHPALSGWYEFSSRVARKYDALEPFSLKFYMLKNAISLSSKNAFDETFEMNTEKLDLDYILGDYAHVEHTFEDILPLGKNTYKTTSDSVFLANKSYYTKDVSGNYILYTDYNIGDSTSSLTTTYYEIDIEALLPHIVLLKNIYPISMNISTYDSLNVETQEIVMKNILNALYSNLNSTQLEFGESINLDYLTSIVKKCDDRIKAVTFDSIKYTTKATYYDDIEGTYKTVTIPENMYSLTGDQKDLNSIIGAYIGRDITCKAILAGVTSLLTPDDIFTVHLNHKFIDYYTDIRSITSQATIDIGSDAVSTYSVGDSSPVIRQTYTLKPNEVLSLYRPSLKDLREFLSGIHYEYLIYNDIKAGQSYELKKGEYIIFYQSYYADSSSSSGIPDGFSVYACAEGIILRPSIDIKAQTNSNAWTSYAKSAVIPAFDLEEVNWYETSTYASSYITEIYNSSNIINNAITGTDSIKIQTIKSVEIEISNNYKFFWVLNTPDYSNDNQIKSYTLFPEYDVATERTAEFEKNSYTLKSGEWLYYIDSSSSNLAICGAGTTIRRNCGVESEDYSDPISSGAGPGYSFNYTPISAFTPSGLDTRFNDGILEKVTSSLNVVSPVLNGWYTRTGSGTSADPYVYNRTDHTSIQSGEEYYVITIDDNTGLYRRIGSSEGEYEYIQTTQTSEVFSEVAVAEELANINPHDKGYYEIVTVNTSGVQDTYARATGEPYTTQYRYTSTNDTSILDRKIFSNTGYTGVDISDVSTYESITIDSNNASYFDYIKQKLVVPSENPGSYKTYYLNNTGTTEIDVIYASDNPSNGDYNHTGTRWYEKNSNNEYVETSDTHPVLNSTANTLKYPDVLSDNYCFEEVPINSYANINFKQNGYFTKLSTGTDTYSWDANRGSDSPSVAATSTMLAYLLELYYTASQLYPADTAEAATNLINYIITNWNTNISYYHPFKLSNKLGWKTKGFRTISSGETASYYGISLSTYHSKVTELANVKKYPRYNLNTLTTSGVSDIIVKASDVASILTETDILEQLTDTGVSDIEVLNRVSGTDLNLRAYLSYLYNTFNGYLPSLFGMELLPKIFRFKDLVRLSNKSYFTPNIYVTKTYGTIPAWTCTALDNDEIAVDPITVIADKWQSIQSNTSLKVTENEIWSFSEGDTVRFEADVKSQKSIVWPIFTNSEIILDLSSYSISYQRSGKSIEEINKLEISGYDWQGYSHLLLNTSSSEGQKLENNQSVLLYELNSSGNLDLVATINGSDYPGVKFQLKYPVSNKSGRYIDITSSDIYGTTLNNTVYEFVPLSNGTMYTYTADNNTYVKFNVGSDKKIINSPVTLPLYIPKGNYLLPVHCETKGVRYSVNKYIEGKKENTSFTYCINSSPVPYTGTGRDIRVTTNQFESDYLGEQLFSYNSNNVISTANNEYYILDNNYHYLSFNVDENPFAEDSYIPVKLPAHLTEYYSGTLTPTVASPQWFGWYEKNSSGEYVVSTNTGTGTDLIEAVPMPSYSTDIEGFSKWAENNNPAENKWYERNGSAGSYYYTLTTDSLPVFGKTYYKDKDFYVSVDLVEAPTLKVLATNPYIDIDSSSISIILGDIFKYENNSLMGDEFLKIKRKLKKLDVDNEYNYTYVPNSNDLISNPLDPKTYFNSNHPFNNYIIPQLDFDNLEYRFIT